MTAAANRLLIVDDEEMIGEILAEFAEAIGFEVKFTISGKAFLKILPDFHPTVVAIDIVMPTMDGIEIVRHLANTGYQGRIILMTGFDPRYTAHAAEIGHVFGLNPVTTLRKPISRESFVRAIGTDIAPSAPP